MIFFEIVFFSKTEIFYWVVNLKAPSFSSSQNLAFELKMIPPKIFIHAQSFSFDHKWLWSQISITVLLHTVKPEVT